MEPDTAHSAVVTDHDFLPKDGQEWGLCQHTRKVPVQGKQGYVGTMRDVMCNLSRATHASGPIYEPKAPQAPIGAER